MRKILLCVITIFAGTLFSGCAGQTKLPKEMPQGAEITYISEGGLLPSFFQITISGKTMKVTERSPETEQKEVVRKATLSDDEVKNLYQAFVDNRLDTIRPNEEVGVADGKSRSIELKFGQMRFYAVTGDGIETTPTDGERFNNIEKAFGLLVKKYFKAG